MTVPSAVRSPAYHRLVGEPEQLVRHRPLRWWSIIAALSGGLTVALCLLTSWNGIWGSHPAYWITLLMVLLCSGGLAFWGWWNSPATPQKPFRTWGLRGVLVVGTGVTIISLVYLRPLGADDVAIAALRSDAAVTVSVSTARIRLQPSVPKSTGLVFYPGAKVDPRAYARILRPVAEAGFPVVIVKFPFNLAVLGVGAADDVVGVEDLVHRWVVGGHSLGGAMAATYATDPHDELAGLLLYAAYPAGPMTERNDLDVTSVYGTEDGLATVDDIETSRRDLPPDTLFVPIDGGIHAFFGDYGEQSGDGTPTISRDDAQRQIVNATLAQLDRIDRSDDGG
jgi:hypothetical protein